LTLTDYLGFVFIIVFIILIVVFLVIDRKKAFVSLRNIPAFNKLARAFGDSVEAGKRIHLSLGRGAINSQQATAGLVGLSVLERMTRIAAISDRPPVATSGDATVAILSQDTIKATSRSVGTSGQQLLASGGLTGVTPLSYAAGVIPVIYDEQSSIDILLGNFDSEAALIADASERNGNVSLAGSDSLTAQAVMYATTREPLIGEEFFASGAYVQAGAMHEASVHAQDILRWVLIGIILIGAALKFLGLA
jgi:hypothetical protein